MSFVYQMTAIYNFLFKMFSIRALFLRYSKNAKVISKRYRDQPKRPLETAIYWVEYVARHKGAKHMHSAGQDLNFLQYHNIDILLAFIAIIWVIKTLIKKCCCSSSKKAPVESSRSKKKTN